MTNTLTVGSPVGVHSVDTIGGQVVPLPAPCGRTHLQFRRFAGCPICHTHLRSFTQRHTELTDVGITEIVFFHSPASELRGYQSQLPFAVVADPDKIWYREFGVQESLRSVMHPSAMFTAMRGYASYVRHRRNPQWSGVGLGDGSTHLGQPADFLLDPDGTVAAVHYGQHADDQWSVDELLDIHQGINRRESQ